MRAFLRPASSPWIVFDRDSRIDDFARSALRVGAVFASSPSLPDVVSSVPLDQPIPGNASTTPFVRPPPSLPSVSITDEVTTAVAPPPMFPPSAPSSETATVDPSNVVVATDLTPVASMDDAAIDAAVASFAPASGRRTAWIVSACAGVLALAAGTAVVVGGRSHLSHLKKASASTHAMAISAPVVAPVTEAVPPPVDPSTLELDDAPPPVAAKVELTPANDPKKHGLGKLTIKADGKTKNVWFDGKRMLGTGTRSFMVACGMHTVAVNEKTDLKDIEVPCNGEFIAAK